MDEKKKNIWHGQHKIGHCPRPAFRGFGFGVRKKANKNAGSRLGMTNRLDNPNVNKVFLYTTSYKPIRHVFRTIVWLNLTGDWDIWHDMMWHDVTKGSGLEMMAVKREKAVNASLTIHRISQCIQSLFETMGKIGKTHTVTWIKYCSKYSMCLLPGEGLLYCFFPFFFHLTVLIVSLVCEFQRQSQAGSVAAEVAIHQDSRQLACHGLPRFSLVCWCWMCWCWSRQLMFKQLHWYSHVEPRLSMEAVISKVLAGDCHGQLWLLDRRPAWRVWGTFDLQVLPCVQHFSNLFCICPKCPHCHRLQLRHLLWSEVWA